MAAEITIAGDKASKPDIRVLGVQTDTKFRWGPHSKMVQEKLDTQTRALKKITVSTWGATFARARHLYLAGHHL